MAERPAPQIELFVLEYIKDFRVKRASEAVGLQAYQGRELLERDDVQAALVEATRARVKRTEMDADAALRETWLMASVNVAQLFNNDWSVKYRDELTEDQQRAITGAKYKQQIDGSMSVEIKTDKSANLALVLRHLGLLNDHVDVNHAGNVTLEMLVPKSIPRPVKVDPLKLLP